MTTSTLLANMNNEQLDKLKENYANLIVDGMDIHSLYQFVYDTLNDKMDKYTDDELIEEVDAYYPELLKNDW